MKQLPLLGINVNTIAGDKYNYKVSIAVNISQGRGANKQTHRSTTNISIVPDKIDEFVKEFNEFVEKFSRKASQEEAIVE